MGGRIGAIGALAAGGLIAAASLAAPGAHRAAAQDATPAATVATSDQGGARRNAVETPAAAVGGGAPTSAPRAGVGPTLPGNDEMASLLGVAAATAAVAASLLRERKSASGR